MRSHIAICVPTLGRVLTHWAGTFADILAPVNMGKIKIFVFGKPVAEARNELVQTAFATEEHNPGEKISHIFWVDDDVIVPSFALVHLFNRRKPIVSGVYFTRRKVSEPLIFDGELEGSAPFRPGEFREVWGHGMGLTLVDMDVYRRMRDETDLGKDKFGFPQWYKTGDPPSERPQGHQFGTEDFYFLDAAHKLGIPAWIDQSKECFGFHCDLQTQEGYPPKQWKEWQAKRTITWDTDDGPVVWKDLEF